MTLFWAKLVWFFGVAGWFMVRYPHSRRSRRTSTVRRKSRTLEFVLLSTSFTGLFVLPAIYVFTGQPRIVSYPFQPALAWAGAAVFTAALWLFRRTHKELGRNWSVTLEVRDQHALVTSGVYSRIRHPMYLAFWLWAVAQALLLPNWVAGLSGLAGFGTLFFLRIRREERMMEEVFGDQYRSYVSRTRRIIPGLY
jgi:protein-S-isoprenylcysteine O-methyltransferase Ste14